MDNKEPIPIPKQSEITDTVKKVSDNIPNDNNNIIENISSYINTLKSVKTKEPIFSRNVDEIINSNEQWGCHEAGLLFVTLLRAKEQEATYIQAFLKEDLINYDKEKKNNYIRGHVFIRHKVGDSRYKIINSTTAEITDEIPNDYILGAEGDDSWDIGLKNGLDDYIPLFEKTKKENNLYKSP